jgi:hypothetical protein
MLLGLPAPVPNRKLRLFALACCLRIEGRLTHPLSRQALVLADKYAEGLATDEDMRELSQRFMEEYNARLAASGGNWNAMDTNDLDAAYGMTRQVFPASAAFSAVRAVPDQSGERLIQCRLLRCIFGNPFRPVPLDPAWLTPTVNALAQALHSDRRLEDLPVLADALEEAGADADLMAHLREPGPHFHGCWAVDLLTGRK